MVSTAPQDMQQTAIANLELCERRILRSAIAQAADIVRLMRGAIAY